MTKHEKLSLLDTLTKQLIDLELALEEAQENERKITKKIKILKEKITKTREI